MPETTVFEGRIRRLSILDEDGRFDAAAAAGVLSDDELRTAWRWMVLSRVMDEIAVRLQREGRMGTYAENAGQEAVSVGSAMVMEQRDWLFPSYRELGACLARGFPPHHVFLFWMGDERGSVAPAGVNNFPFCIPVGTQNLHAVGAAWAFQLRKTGAVAVACLGDGATSKGDFHEAANFAGVFRLPVVFLCANNQWAISVPRASQTASETIAQKALAYGIAGVQVDGNDLFAVVKACREAFARARAGEGATFIEAVTYRLSNHTTADDAGRYRDPAEVEMWRRRDPLLRLGAHLRQRGMLDDASDKRIREECRAVVDEAVRKAESTPPQTRRDIFRWVYAEMTPALAQQFAHGSVPEAEYEGVPRPAAPRTPPPSAPGEYLPPEPETPVGPGLRVRSRSRAGTG